MMKKYVLYICALFTALGLSTSAALAAQPAGSLSITTYGATGGDTSDDTAAINSAINDARSQGKVLYIPAGNYYHSGAFEVGGITFTGEGDTSVIHGTASGQWRGMTITQTTNPTVLSNFKIMNVRVSRDGFSEALFIDHAANFTIDNITIDGGNDAGILNWGGHDAKIINNHVLNTLSDCIHDTGGAYNIVVDHNTTSNCGDDMIAVVSYQGDGLTHNILIQNNDVNGQTGGRGITVVGGADVTIQNNTIANSFAAGILMASEPSYNSYGDNNILVKNNTLTNDGNANMGHASIFVSMNNPGQPGTNIHFENNTVNASKADGVKTEGTENNIAFITTAVSNPAGSAFNLGSGTNLYCQGNTLNGSPTTPANCNGSLNFTVTGSSLTYTSAGGTSGGTGGTGGGTSNFSITAPANGASVSGTFTVTGLAGSTWLNVIGTDGSGNKICPDTAPANGMFTISCNASSLPAGSNTITFTAYSTAAGQTGFTSTTAALTVNVTSATTSPCTQAYDNTVAVPSGYGAAYNLFSAGKELTVQVDCTTATPVLNAGSGAATQYIYKLGYAYKGGAWQQVNLTGSSALISSNWYAGSATGPLPFTATDLSSNWNYIVSYICNWTGTAWKCGCADTACATSNWQLQAIKR